LDSKVISCKRIKRIKLVKALIVAESQIYRSPALIIAASHILASFRFKSNLMQKKKEKQAANSSNRCSIVTHM